MWRLFKLASVVCERQDLRARLSPGSVRGRDEERAHHNPTSNDCGNDPRLTCLKLEVRREFYALWNQIVRKARKDNERWISFDWFATFSSLYTKVLIRSQHDSSLPLVMTMLFYWSHFCVGVKHHRPSAIIWTRHLTSTTTQPPQPLRAPSGMTMPPRHPSLLSLPLIHIRLRRPHMPHFVLMKAPQVLCPLTTIYLSPFPCDLSIILNVTAFLPLHPTRLTYYSCDTRMYKYLNVLSLSRE